MPELPEVETVRRGLRPVMEGVVIERVEQRRADLRFPLPGGFAKRLTGRRIEALNRRAKYLLGHLDDASVLIMHLGMSGRFTISDENHPRPPNRSHDSPDHRHEHIVFHMIGGAQVAYSDPRRFGMMDLVASDEFAAHRLLASLGPEPLGPNFTTATLASSLAGRRTPIKAALLDQRIVAGLGNIYVNEALFRARIRPQREAATLVGSVRAGGPLSRLVDSVRAVLHDALDAGGSSLRDYAAADGSLGYFQNAFEVYGREGAPCARSACGGTISRAAQSGRATYWCPRCQR